MNTRRPLPQMPNAIRLNQNDETKKKSKESFFLPIGVAIAVSIGLSILTNTVKAETTETVDIQHYMNSQQSENAPGKASQNTQQRSMGNNTKIEKSNSSDQSNKMDNTNDPVNKPKDGRGNLPTFAQADVNSDHYITKDELKNFPYLLQVFDKIDAGQDGKLEQHEYQSLKMETKREGEIR